MAVRLKGALRDAPLRYEPLVSIAGLNCIQQLHPAPFGLILEIRRVNLRTTERACAVYCKKARDPFTVQALPKLRCVLRPAQRTLAYERCAALCSTDKSKFKPPTNMILDLRRFLMISLPEPFFELFRVTSVLLCDQDDCRKSAQCPGVLAT